MLLKIRFQPSLFFRTFSLPYCPCPMECAPCSYAPPPSTTTTRQPPTLTGATKMDFNTTILTNATVVTTPLSLLLTNTKNDTSIRLDMYLNGFCYLYVLLITVYCVIVSVLLSKNTIKYQKLNKEYIELVQQQLQTSPGGNQGFTFKRIRDCRGLFSAKIFEIIFICKIVSFNISNC